MQQHAASEERTSPPRRIFYGWWIVGIGCLQEAVKSGTFNTGFTLYFLPVLTEWHLSRAATSLPFSLAKLEAALAGPLVGYLIDRFDLRVTMALGTVLAGVGFLLLAATQRYATFLLVFLSLLSVGFHMGFNQGSMAAVNYWFRARRSFAMSLLQTGQALGGVLLFPLVALAVLKLGWRAAALLSGGAVLLLLPLVGFMRPTPERMGLRPDGAPPSPPAGPGRAASLRTRGCAPSGSPQCRHSPVAQWWSRTMTHRTGGDGGVQGVVRSCAIGGWQSMRCLRCSWVSLLYPVWLLSQVISASSRRACAAICWWISSGVMVTGTSRKPSMKACIASSVSAGSGSPAPSPGHAAASGVGFPVYSACCTAVAVPTKQVRASRSSSSQWVGGVSESPKL
jgi:MFS family permease